MFVLIVLKLMRPITCKVWLETSRNIDFAQLWNITSSTTKHIISLMVSLGRMTEKPLPIH